MIIKEIEQVTLEHLGRRNDWLEPEAHDTGIPGLEKTQSGACLGTFPKVTKLFFDVQARPTFEIIIGQIAQPGAAPAVEVFQREEKEEFAALQGLFSFLLELAVLGAPSPLRMRRLSCCQARHSKGDRHWLVPGVP